MTARLQEYREILDRHLNDKSKPWTKYFEKIEAQTGVNRVHAFVGLVAFTGLYLVFGFGAGLLCNSIGFVYPAYMSMRALESPQKDDDTKWLTYWVVYACFSLVEYFSDFIVGWFPFYWLLKCIFVIWCYLPTEYNGSLIIYHRVIRPYYLKHHGRIDNVASSVTQALKPKLPQTTTMPRTSITPQPATMPQATTMPSTTSTSKDIKIGAAKVEAAAVAGAKAAADQEIVKKAAEHIDKNIDKLTKKEE